jgi:hypothetical protein
MENLVKMVVTIILVKHSVRVSLKHVVLRRLIVKIGIPSLHKISHIFQKVSTSVPEVLEICSLTTV